MVSFNRLHYERKDKQILGGGASRSPGEKRMAATLGPMDTVIVSKFIKTLEVAEGLPTGPEQAKIHKRESDRPPSDIFKTRTELMYGGQGKIRITLT
jgi:hypothetical protein